MVDHSGQLRAVVNAIPDAIRIAAQRGGGGLPGTGGVGGVAGAQGDKGKNNPGSGTGSGTGTAPPAGPTTGGGH
jgi:hypothetical protein